MLQTGVWFNFDAYEYYFYYMIKYAAIWARKVILRTKGQ